MCKETSRCNHKTMIEISVEKENVKIYTKGHEILLPRKVPAVLDADS